MVLSYDVAPCGVVEGCRKSRRDVALGPFPLPEGTTALLRVGVDASPMLAVQEGIEWRHRILYLVVGLLVLVSFAGSWLLDRWARRRREAEQLLATREEESRHWQTISQMAQTVAHEVRNLLNTLKMAAQRLQREFSIRDSERLATCRAS